MHPVWLEDRGDELIFSHIRPQLAFAKQVKNRVLCVHGKSVVETLILAHKLVVLVPCIIKTNKTLHWSPLVMIEHLIYIVIKIQRSGLTSECLNPESIYRVDVNFY